MIPNVHFDWTISLGTIIDLVALLLGLFAAYNRLTVKIEARFSRLETRVGDMYDWWKGRINKLERESV